MNQPVAPFVLVQVAVKNAEGHMAALGWVLDPRERSARMAKDDIQSAWGVLPANSKNLEALVNLLVDRYGFMRPAKTFQVEVSPTSAPSPDAPPRKPDAAWNWKSVPA